MVKLVTCWKLTSWFSHNIFLLWTNTLIFKLLTLQVNAYWHNLTYIWLVDTSHWNRSCQLFCWFTYFQKILCTKKWVKLCPITKPRCDCLGENERRKNRIDPKSNWKVKSVMGKSSIHPNVTLPIYGEREWKWRMKFHNICLPVCIYRVLSRCCRICIFPYEEPDTLSPTLYLCTYLSIWRCITFDEDIKVSSRVSLSAIKSQYLRHFMQPPC